MQIYIQHHGQQAGPFSPEHVRSGLADGTYSPSDLAWYEGAADWLPLSRIPGISSSGPPSLPGAAQAPTRTSALAVWSLVLGIFALIGAGLTSIPAVICGHLGLKSIKESAGTRSGGGLAIAGLVTGYLGFLIFGIAVLAGLTAPMVIRQTKRANQTEAVANARSIGLALYEFETEYGSYPDDTTAAAVADGAGTEELTGTTSNAYFRQVIRSGMAGSERIFHTKSQGSRRPDNLTDGSHALEKGECGFAYISNSGTGDRDPRPVAMAPFVPGTTRFDPQPFAGKAVILWTDNAVTSLPIDSRSGQVMRDGKDLLDPDHPVWGGKPPVIAMPE